MRMMKRLCGAVVSLLLAVSSWAQPKMKFDKEKNNFGTVLWSNPVTAVFKVTNIGDAPLLLNKVNASCACTAADWPHTAIQPGETAQIKATFDAKALGTFYKEVEICSNASAGPVYLSMTGRVVATATEEVNAAGFEVVMGDVRLSRDVVEFDQVNRGTEPTEEILVMNTSRAPFEPVLMHLPDYLEATANPARIPAGRTGKIRLTLKTDKLYDMGLTQTSVFLARYYGDTVGDENEISVSAILLPDFSRLSESQLAHAPKIRLSATALHIPLVKKSKGKGVVLVSNVGEAPLKIDRLQVFGNAVSVSLPKREIAPGESVKMKVQVDRSKLKKKRRPRILMITNDPENAEQIIHIETN